MDNLPPSLYPFSVHTMIRVAPSPPIRQNWFWIFLPAILIAAMQLVTIPLVSRKLNIAALISFQAMLSSWPWLAMTGLGLEKKAREVASYNSNFVAFQSIWINIVALSIVIGVTIGIIGGLLFGNLASWLLFCGFSAVSGAMSPAREIFFARGKADWIGRTHAFALTLSLSALLACLKMPPSLVAIALIWVVPQFVAWAYVSSKAGFEFGRPANPAVTLVALRESFPFVLQGAGFIALSTFDVLIMRTQLDNQQLLEYILGTRTLALAFLFSGAAGNTLVHRTLLVTHHAWFRLLSVAFALHLTVSLVAVVGIGLLGDLLFPMLIPDIGFHFANIDVLVALGALAVGRSLSEAAMQMTGRFKTNRVALNVFLLSTAGVAQLALWPSTNYVEALRHVALGWSLPAAYLLALIFAKTRK